MWPPSLLLLSWPSWLQTERFSSDLSFWPLRVARPVIEHNSSQFQRQSCYSCFTHPRLKKFEQVRTSTHFIWRHYLESHQKPSLLILVWCPRLGHWLLALSRGVFCLLRAVFCPLPPFSWSVSEVGASLSPLITKAGLGTNFDAFITLLFQLALLRFYAIRFLLS